MSASLTVVGTGIKFLAHLTTEAKAYIQNSEKVLYLVNEPACKEWIIKNNKNAESLDQIYFKFEHRALAYDAITKYILENLKSDIHLCVVMYGHPTVFAQPALEAAKIAKNSGYETKILPGISAEACLFADLMIDPGSCGCQSYEATHFLQTQKPIHIGSHLILWQIGMIGEVGLKPPTNKEKINELKNYLLKQYPAKHEVYIYEAAQYPGFPPRIEPCALEVIDRLAFTTISTLYVPPCLSYAY